MAKKKKVGPASKQFNRNPFSKLKGFAVSAERKEEPAESAAAGTPGKAYGSFADEMELLGVRPLHPEPEFGNDAAKDLTTTAEVGKQPNEQELFLSAMEQLQVNFSDRVPDVDDGDAPVTATPRRMKQLRQGKIRPEATLDLHGLMRREALAKLEFFLHNARHRGLRTLLVITGKGTHSQDGAPVLRNAVERFLAAEAGEMIVEWGRAPKEYGGEGAVVLFLRGGN